MARAGYEIHLVATDKNSSCYESGGVIIHPLPRSRSRLERMSRRWKVADIASGISADLYHVHEPELLGPVLSRVGNKPVVFDAHESYLDVLSQRRWIPHFLRPLVKALWERIEPGLVKKCRAVVTVAEPMAERYSTLHERVEIVRNFPDLSSEEFKDILSRDRQQACVFAGGLKRDRNIQNMVRAIGLLSKRNVSLQLWLAGQWESNEYRQAIFNLAAQEGVSNQVHYSGLLSHKDALALESRASIGMVTLLPIPNTLKTLPIKLFECMALGLPVIYSDFPIIQEYVREYEVGIAVNPKSPEQIAVALETLVSNPDLAQRMGDAGKRAVRERFNWGVEGSKLNRLYQDILNPTDPQKALLSRPT